MRLRPTLLALALVATPVAAHAQATPAQPAAPAAQPPAARPEDVASVDAIIAALYAVISGPPGQARDWNRMRSLFHPAARMEPIVPRREGGGFEVRVLTPDDYVQRSGEMLTRHGFTERELARRQERFGNLVHVWSTYEGRFTGDAPPTKDPVRGINSIQLSWDGTRWWILNLAWDSERPGSALPPEYLPR